MVSAAAKDRSAEFYKITLEALGMYGSNKIILNKLNKVRAHSDDAELRNLIEQVERALLRAGDHPGTPTRNLSGCKEIAALIEARCNEQLGRH